MISPNRRQPKLQQSPITTTLIWCLALFVVFCPLAVRAYRRQQ